METGATVNVPGIVENHAKTGIDEQFTTEKSTSEQSSTVKYWMIYRFIHLQQQDAQTFTLFFIF